MKGITIERQPDRKRLEELDVYHWPVWEKEASEFPWHYAEKETAYILEGEVIVSSEDGSESVEIKAGDLVCFEAGLRCRWHIKQAIRKHYQFG